MSWFLESTQVITKSKNTFIWKKVLLASILIFFFTYIIITNGLSGIITVLLSCLLPLIMYILIRKVHKAPMKSKLFSKNIIDVLPIEISLDDESLKITLKKAEIINNKVTDTTYQYKNSENTKIVYYQNAGLLFVLPENNAVKKKNTNSSVVFYVDKEIGNEIITTLKEKSWNVDVVEDDVTAMKKEQIAKKKQMNKSVQ